MLLNFFIFKKIMQHQEQALMLHTQRGLGWGVCWWEQWFLIQVLLMFLPYSCEHMCETGWQDSVEITHFQTLFNAENTVVTSQIFLSSSVINCWKTVNEWSVLKIKHGAACSLFIMCADFGGSTLHSRRALNTAAVFFWKPRPKIPRQQRLYKLYSLQGWKSEQAMSFSIDHLSQICQYHSSYISCIKWQYLW